MPRSKSEWKEAKDAMTKVPIWYRYRLLALIFAGVIFFFVSGILMGHVLFNYHKSNLQTPPMTLPIKYTPTLEGLMTACGGWSVTACNNVLDEMFKGIHG